MKKNRILFVVTSVATMGKGGKPTGYYLSEVTHPWKVLTEAGYDIDFVSPLGGDAPADAVDLNDPVNREFWEDPKWHAKIASTMRPDQVNPDDYAAIFYAGGHGVMWDFADNQPLAAICSRIYAAGGVVGAVCHGPAGLLNVRTADGRYLVAGRQICSFTNAEEVANGTATVVPYLLESRLRLTGAHFVNTDKWGVCCVTDGRLVTGQNPMSARSVGLAIAAELGQ